MLGHIYCFRNRTNGKRYIGKTMKSVDERWKAHLISVRRGSQTHFHNAIRRHGVDVFELEWVKHVEVFDVSADFLDEPNIRTSLDLEEVLLIEHHDTFEGDGYNMTPGCDGGVTGDGFYGVTREEHARRCMGDVTPEEHAMRSVSKLFLENPDEHARRCGRGNFVHAEKAREVQRKYMKPVRCVELDRNFESVHAAERKLRNEGHRVYQPLISMCANGCRKMHAGFHWRWCDRGHRV